MADPRGEEQPARRRALVPFLVAGILAVVGFAAVLGVTAAQGPPRTRTVSLVTDDGFRASPSWSFTGQATLDSADGRSTVLAVEVRRGAVDAVVPALVSTFDGGGGGDAVPVTCRADATRSWTAAVGDTQAVLLPCDRHVAPAALASLQYVDIGTGG